MTDNGEPARLVWSAEPLVPRAVREQLVGSGAPFEMASERVLGERCQVFVQRQHHLVEMVSAAGEIFSDRPFLVCGDDSVSFAEFATDVAGLADTLEASFGVGPGDRVGFMSAATIDALTLYLSSIALGGVAVGLNSWWTPTEITDALGLTTPSVIFADSARAARLRRAKMPLNPPLVAFDEIEHPDASEPSQALRSRTNQANEDAPAVILFTSGTTGRSKAATLSHRNLIHLGQVNALRQAIGTALMGPSADSGSGVVLVGGQLHHISGLAPILVNGLVMGMTVVLPRPGRWEPVKEIAERRVTAWSSVPSQFRQALDDPSFDPAAAASVSSIISAGAPLAGGLAAELRFSMPAARLANAYGMTETTGIGTSEIDPFADPASVGVPLPGCDVEIRKTSGELAAAGEMGEVHLRSSGVFLGYWADREATSRALAPGRWYRTGDFGSVAEGRLHLRSRMRDLIIRGGENIDPTEIEQRLIEHPDVLDVAVVGQDDETLGQVVKAVVVPRPGSVLDESAVKSWAGETMAAFKVPAWVEFRTSLPYTENGKVKKHELEKSTP